jgi:hypothetical protein
MIGVLFIIGFVLIFKDYCNQIIRYNNQILELKTEVIKINLICQTLELSKININYDIISKKYIYLPIIIILINIIYIIILYYNPIENYILLQLLPFIMIISIILIILIIYIGNYKINTINNNEIRNKKDEINKKYIDNLLIILDTSNDINNINLKIDEYISNYSYLDNNIALSILNNINLDNKIDKRIFIIKLEKKLIQKKNNELMAIMNSKLKTYTEITPEIVKYELDDCNIKLYEYKKQLLLKITAINELSQVIEIIINISS